MAQLEPGISKPPQPLRQQSPEMNNQSSLPPTAIEGKDATIHDFLSLGGSKSTSSTIAVAQNGLQSSIATQDLLQPLQKTTLPASSNVLPAAFVLGSSRPHISSVDYYTGQQMAYNLVNGGLEMQPNYRSSDVSYVAKAHGPHGVSNNKHLLQQQKKKLTWIVSEDDEDEDDESLDHGYNSKKEIGHQKFDNAQQLEGKNMDSKGLTPRSKHSATEQRRRSKINDRFQMLRQLLPNSDQKRDKASFLLEVIEHIQMLHEKVKNYEAAEHLGQLQERPKALTWDKTSGCKEGVIDVSYGPSLMYDIKGAADVNGYMRYPSSPLRVVGHGNGITHLELIASRGHAANRLLQIPTSLSSHENNSLISKPALLTFTTPPSISTEEPVTPTLFPSSSRSLPESQTRFAQLLRQEEQAAIRAKRPHGNEEAIASPHVYQAGKPMLPQMSSFLHDPDCEKLRSPEQSSITHSDRRTSEEMDEQLRPSPVKDMHQRNIGSTSRECKKDKGRTSHGLESTPGHDQGPPAVLGGTVNISSPYSQGLLDSLTRALQSSGVDLAQASISVQIDLGKPSGSALKSSTEIATLNTAMVPLQNKEIGFLQESEHSTKRLKVEIDS